MYCTSICVFFHDVIIICHFFYLAQHMQAYCIEKNNKNKIIIFFF